MQSTTEYTDTGSPSSLIQPVTNSAAPAPFPSPTVVMHGLKALTLMRCQLPPQPTSVNAIIWTCFVPSSSQSTSSISLALICCTAHSVSFQIYYCNTILLAIAIAFKTNLFRTQRPLSSHNIRIGACTVNSAC